MACSTLAATANAYLANLDVVGHVVNADTLETDGDIVLILAATAYAYLPNPDHAMYAVHAPRLDMDGSPLKVVANSWST